MIVRSHNHHWARVKWCLYRILWNTLETQQDLIYTAEMSIINGELTYTKRHILNWQFEHDCMLQIASIWSKFLQNFQIEIAVNIMV